ncbi:MAG: triose-phosphate isomerase, partial [Chloroflexota bacterium]|nr:triose-phosphate isomerase [Chloroflexota bacterium]
MTIYLYANWKMNFTQDEADQFGSALTEAVRNLPEHIEVILFPGNALLATVSQSIKNSKHLGLGAQNIHWERDGAFTGETSVGMLPDVCTHVLVGHSERRRYFGETEAIINRKIVTIMEGRLKAILCVGEGGDSVSNVSAEDVLEGQLHSALGGIEGPVEKRLVVAYEPVWAIGSSLPATPEIVNSRAGFIKEFISQLLNVETNESTPVIYGGSVTSENVGSYLDMENIDGVLLGGASLNLESF